MSDRRKNLAAAVVIGLDSITGLQTARVLWRRGIRVIGVARNPGHPSCGTRACERVVVSDTASEQLIGDVNAIARGLGEPPVLFPCTDLSVLLVSRNREQLASSCRMVLPEPGVIELLLDKAAFQTYATQAGLPIAATSVLHDRGDAARAASTLRYPCILKPAVKTATWQARTRAKLFKVADARELLRVYDRCHTWTDLLLAQEWVDGPDTAHVTCNAYFDASSRPVATFVSQKLRQWPLEGGVGCLSREHRDDVVLEETIRLFQGVGHRGLAYLEMKHDRQSGRAVIIEPNVGRPTGRSAAADVSGVELLYSQYCDALGRTLPTGRPQRYDRSRWIYLRQDCQSAYAQWRNGTLGAVDYLKSIAACRADAVFSWSDPRPFVADVMTGIGKARDARSRLGRPGQAPAHAVPATAIHAEAGPESPVDFDVHGIVGLRLLGASASDVAVVRRQLGPLQRRLERPPDIVIRFIDHLSIDGLQWIEYGRTGYSADGFFVVQSGKRPSRVRIAFDQIGAGCEIVCQRGVRSIPSLITLVGLTALGRGYTPLHASAFVHDGTGVLVTGWAKGGKTEALLAFAAHGAEYIGDEWILLDADGRTMHGIPEFVRFQDWHLERVAAARRQVSRIQRLAFKGVRHVDRLHGRLRNGRISRLLPARLFGATLPALKRQLNVQLDPVTVFGAGPSRFAAPLDRVYFMVSHEASTIRVDRVDPQEVAERMTASVCFEQLPLTAAYLAYQFAFPGRHSALLDSARDAQRHALSRALAGKDAFVVRHPYPCDLQQLFDVMTSASNDGPAVLRMRTTRDIAPGGTIHGEPFQA
jgi:predicted ATP-grasp superfamily ATP-dependent carboligase